MFKLDNALLALNSLVSNGMEYPTAEYHVANAFDLTSKELQSVADDYLLETLFSGEKFLPVMLIKKGEYVKRKIDAKKVYVRGEYNRSSGKYALQDCDDTNREIFVSGITMLHIGFTY